MAPSGVHLSPVYNGRVEPVTLSDAYGEVRFYLLPFIKPANVRRFYPDAVIESYTDALRCAVEHMDIAPSTRNVLVTHQFVTGGVRSESEDITVGGTDNVDAAVFDGFDYVALGHLHGAQSIGRERSAIPARRSNTLSRKGSGEEHNGRGAGREGKRVDLDAAAQTAARYARSARHL